MYYKFRENLLSREQMKKSYQVLMNVWIFLQKGKTIDIMLLLLWTMYPVDLIQFLDSIWNASPIIWTQATLSLKAFLILLILLDLKKLVSMTLEAEVQMVTIWKKDKLNQNTLTNHYFSLLKSFHLEVLKKQIVTNTFHIEIVHWQKY